jgi:hypothetical protein
VHTSFERQLTACDVTVAQWNVLVTVYRGDATTTAEAARFIGIDPGAVSRLVDRLAAKELMTRSADPQSRRSLPPAEQTALVRLLRQLVPTATADQEESSSMPEPAPARSVTKSVAIDRPAAQVHEYLADARNWPEWSVVNVLEIQASNDPGWWKMTTTRGQGQLRIRADAFTGLLDHDFRDPQASWTVPARVVPNGRGAEFFITFFQPGALDDAEFDRQTALVDTELATLKRVLESR